MSPDPVSAWCRILLGLPRAPLGLLSDAHEILPYPTLRLFSVGTAPPKILFCTSMDIRAIIFSLGDSELRLSLFYQTTLEIGRAT